MQLPSPAQFAQTLAYTSFDLEEKRQIVASLPYLSDAKIIDLYANLLKLQSEEIELMNQSRRLDLKYQIKLEQLIAEAKNA